MLLPPVLLLSGSCGFADMVRYDTCPSPFGNLLIESLPVIGMILTTISFRFTEAKTIRRFGIFNSPMWLTYNIANFSVGAICCEVMNLISIVVGMIRFDIKKKSKKA